MYLSIADFNEGQVIAVDNLQGFLDPDDPRAFTGLFGFAGTGKSTILSYLGHTAVAHSRKIAVCAPTHKAVSVLQWMGGDRSALRRFETVNKMLHIKGEIDEKTGETVFRTTRNYSAMPLIAEGYDTLIIDECSMFDKAKVELVEDIAKHYPIKVIYVGDPFQLPPVTEESLNGGRSYSFNVADRTILKEVERSHGPVAACAHAARKAIGQNVRIDIPTTPGTQRITSEDELLEQYMEVVDTGQILTFRNDDVKKWNDRVRYRMHGPDVPYFYPGDRLIAAQTRGAVTSSEEFVVRTVRHAKFMDVDCYELQFMDQLYPLHVCDPTQEPARIAQETKLKQAWLKDKKAGRSSRASYERWQTFADTIVDLRHGYAQTIHKSQGSTYDQVFVEEGALFRMFLTPPDIKFRGKLLYVAYSRASKRLVVL